MGKDHGRKLLFNIESDGEAAAPEWAETPISSVAELPLSLWEFVSLSLSLSTVDLSDEHAASL